MDPVFQSFAVLSSYSSSISVTINGVSETVNVLTFDSDMAKIIFPSNGGVACYADIFKADLVTSSEALLSSLNRPPRIVAVNQTGVTVNGLAAYSVASEIWDNGYTPVAGDVVCFEGATNNPPEDILIGCGMTCASYGSTLIEYEKSFRQIHRDILRLGVPTTTECGYATSSTEVIQVFDYTNYGKITNAYSYNPWTGIGSGTIGEACGDTNRLAVPIIQYSNYGLITNPSQVVINDSIPDPGEYGCGLTGKVPRVVLNEYGQIAEIQEIDGAVAIVQSQTITGASASIDFINLDSTFDIYELLIYDLFLDSVTDLNIRISTDNGSSWVSTSSYAYNRLNINTGASAGNSASATLIPISGEASRTIDTASSRGFSAKIEIFNPSGITSIKRIQAQSGYYTSAISAGFVQQITSGYYNSTATFNGIQIFPSSGNITSGKCILQGRKA